MFCVRTKKQTSRVAVLNATLMPVLPLNFVASHSRCWRARVSGDRRSEIKEEPAAARWAAGGGGHSRSRLPGGLACLAPTQRVSVQQMAREKPIGTPEKSRNRTAGTSKRHGVVGWA